MKNDITDAFLHFGMVTLLSMEILLLMNGCAAQGTQWIHFNKDGADVYFRVTATESGKIVSYEEKLFRENIVVDGKNHEKLVTIRSGGKIDCAKSLFLDHTQMQALTPDGALLKTLKTGDPENSQWMASNLERDRLICKIAGL